MEDKSFELLTKMYSEIVEVKAGVKTLDDKVGRLDNKVSSIDSRLIKLQNPKTQSSPRSSDFALHSFPTIKVKDYKDKFRNQRFTYYNMYTDVS